VYEAGLMFLLGYALIEFPRSMWNTADPEMALLDMQVGASVGVGAVGVHMCMFGLFIPLPTHNVVFLYLRLTHNVVLIHTQMKAALQFKSIQDAQFNISLVARYTQNPYTHIHTHTYTHTHTFTYIHTHL
jgi:hypothetical protein